MPDASGMPRRRFLAAGGTAGLLGALAMTGTAGAETVSGSVPVPSAGASKTMTPSGRFVIEFPQEKIDYLKRRLRETQWALDLDNENDYYGISTVELKKLVDYWINGFDFGAIAAQLNSFTNYRIPVDGVPVQFIHEPGVGPAPIPIVLSHGWPWTYWDYSKVIRPLADPAAYGGDPADAFDVIVPSLSGFGYSTPTTGDMNFWKMAEVWNTLMTDVLGHQKYAASGTDYGALVTGQLGHKYAANLYGIHLGQDLVPGMFNGEEFWSITQPIPDGTPEPLRQETLDFYTTYEAHVTTHMLEAQVVTHGLTDSPAYLLAYLLERYKHWSDKNGNFDEVFPRDHILTEACIYWFNDAIGQSIRSYRNAVRYPWTPSHPGTPAITAPAGFTFLCGDHYPPGATVENRVSIFENGPTRQWFNPIYTKAHAQGGHFVPWENPDAYIGDVRATFRLLR